MKPIVSLAGPPSLHQRAQNYNERLQVLVSYKDDLQKARDWNAYGRFKGRFWAPPAAPTPTGPLHDKIAQLTCELEAEYKDIVLEARGTVNQ